MTDIIWDEAVAEAKNDLSKDNIRLRAALESIAGWRNVNIAGEYEHGLRDIIRSITDCAAAALEASHSPQGAETP